MTQKAQKIPEGYKQTEIGVIPDDWDVVNLSSLGYFRSGSGFPLKYQGGKTGKYPFYKVSDMNNIGNSVFMFNANHWISEEVRKQIGIKTLPVNTIIFAKIGAAIFLERKKVLSRESCIDNNMMGFVIDERITNPRFIHYLFLKISLGKLVSATALPSLNGRQIGDLKYGIPKYSEQTAIATILSDVDAFIEKLENLIVKKKAIKQGAMQQLLTGKKRLPGFRGEWSEIELKSILDFANGKPYEKHIVDKGKYNLITLDSINIKGKLKNEHKTVNLYDNSLKKGDIVIILSDIAHGDFLGLCDVIPEDNKYVLNQRVGRIRLDGCNPFFMRLVVNMNQIHFKKRGQGTSQRHIYKRDIEALKILLPPTKEEQNTIANTVSDMDTEIEALEKSLLKYRQIKTGMMQQLLTGKIRLIRK